MAAKSRTQKSNTDSNFDSLFGIKSGEGFVSGLKTIALNRIVTGAQPRTIFNDEELQELSNSIAALRARGEGVDGTGILQPVLVTREGDNYKLIAGERRLRASKLAGLTELPALEVSSREDTLLAVQLIENLQRAELNPLDEAHALKKLTTEQKLSIRDLATLVGKTRGYVTNRLDLLKMGEDVQAMVAQRQDTLRAAVHINHVDDSDQRAALIQAVLEEGIGEREVKRRIEVSNEPPPAITVSRSEVSSREDTETKETESLAVGVIASDLKRILTKLTGLYADMSLKRVKILDEQEREQYIQQITKLENDLAKLRKKL
jgi:ParB/RepB/Spo0J family partition protein